MNIEIADDLSSITTEANREIRLPPYDPSTMKKFSDKADVERFILSIADGNKPCPYWLPVPTEEEVESLRLELEEATYVEELAKVDSAFVEETTAMISTYTALERESWTVQLEEARAYDSNPSALTPMLDGILRIDTEETRDNLVTTILRKSQALKGPTGEALGRKSKEKRHLKKRRAEAEQRRKS
jgi:hypothetical protein